MRELVILSGKGGTGKTSITAAFASFSNNMVLCDADVDAADLHLLMAPDIKQTSRFQGGNEAVIHPDKCTQCGLCMTLCRFNAVKETYEVDPIECEGCGVCYDLCPENAIEFPVKTCGEWYISDTRFGPMVHARLGIAEENSGRLVALVRQEARKLVQQQKIDLILTDGPPGIGCPVIASIGQANAILIVTEPTVSGKHDLDRLAQLAAHFKIPAFICVNKYDLNPSQTKAIEDLARERNMVCAGRIPFDKNFTASMIQGKSIIETDETSRAGIEIRKIWETIMKQPAMKIERLI